MTAHLKSRTAHESRHVCMPLVVLFNFALFEYLVITYLSRRREPYIIALWCTGALSFLSVAWFALVEPSQVKNLNSVSEVCTVITFLLQITMLGRQVLRKLRLQRLKLLVYTAELLIFAGVVVIVLNVEEIFFDAALGLPLKELDMVTVDAGLAFIFFFRFYYLSITTSYRKLWETQRTEIVAYFLLMTHEYLFLAIGTGMVDTQYLTYIKAVYMRVLVAVCIGLTIHSKWRSQRQSQSARNTGRSSVGGEPVRPAERASSVHTVVRLKSSRRWSAQRKSVKRIKIQPHGKRQSKAEEREKVSTGEGQNG